MGQDGTRSQLRGCWDRNKSHSTLDLDGNNKAGCFISRADTICLIECGLLEKREKSGMTQNVFDLSYYVNDATIF